MIANMLLKQELNPQQLAIVNSEFTKKAKSKTVAYVLWLFLGGIGGHRYYSGDIVRAIFMTFTLGGLGIWALIDVFFIGARIEEINERIETSIIASVKQASPQPSLQV